MCALINILSKKGGKLERGEGTAERVALFKCQSETHIQAQDDTYHLSGSFKHVGGGLYSSVCSWMLLCVSWHDVTMNDKFVKAHKNEQCWTSLHSESSVCYLVL